MKKFRVYPDGTVENNKGITRGTPDKAGYLTKWNPNNNKNMKVHRLVAMRYLPNPDNLPEVNHLDGDKTNNHYTNLEWTNRSGNLKHAYNKGLMSSKGSKNGNSKLTVEQVLEIRKLYSEGLTRPKLAKMFNVKYITIYDIITRRTWSHI